MDLRKSSAMMAALVFTCASVARRLECTWKSPLASGQMKFSAAKTYAVFLAASCKDTGSLSHPRGQRWPSFLPRMKGVMTADINTQGVKRGSQCTRT